MQWFSFTFMAFAVLFVGVSFALPTPIRLHHYSDAGSDGPRPTPLLAGRIDKALELWNKQHQHGKFVVSGGQGADEIVSKLRPCAFIFWRRAFQLTQFSWKTNPTTWENLRYSLAVIRADRTSAA